MPKNSISQQDYEKLFFSKVIRKNALEAALDIRKFEIELYWKRASYFWTFIGATLAGYITVQATMDNSSNKQDLSILLSCLGIVFSIAWVLVIRGSKYWQENWEKHVDMLEDSITGPLYKTILERGESKNCMECFEHLITGPSSFSVSKINQIISIFVAFLWMILLLHSMPELNLTHPLNLYYLSVVSLSIFAIVLFFTLGRSYSGGYWHQASYRTTKIKTESEE